MNKDKLIKYLDNEILTYEKRIDALQINNPLILRLEERLSALITIKQHIQSEPEETCTYTQWNDDSNSWECSECGLVWTLNADSPKDNDMNFCPKCGLKIKH